MAFHVPTREERLFFDVADVLVGGIFVEAGQDVEAGDIIAILSRPELTEAYTQAIWQEESLRLNIDHARRRRTHARGQGADVTRYTAQINRHQRELELLLEEIDFLGRQIEDLYVRATIDGTVAQVMYFYEGVRSVTTSPVAIIFDQTYSMFEVRSSEVAPYMLVGDTYTIAVNQIPHEAVVVDPGELGVDRAHLQGHEAFLILLDQNVVLPGNPTATIHVISREALGVLFVPARAVHVAHERYFVYVQNEIGVRTVRDVEVGSRGNLTIEIVSGLDEGELVIVD